jgi:hypothetical protein
MPAPAEPGAGNPGRLPAVPSGDVPSLQRYTQTSCPSRFRDELGVFLPPGLLRARAAPPPLASARTRANSPPGVPFQISSGEFSYPTWGAAHTAPDGGRSRQHRSGKPISYHGRERLLASASRQSTEAVRRLGGRPERADSGVGVACGPARGRGKAAMTWGTRWLDRWRRE